MRVPSVRSFVEQVASASPYETTLRLSVLLILLYASQAPLVSASSRIVCGLMLVFPSLLWRAWCWWLLLSILILGNASDWFWIDNHQYLIIYWTAACACSLYQREMAERASYLSKTARTLVGLAFTFAVLWKIVGGEYLNGTFLHFTFLTDPRVRPAAAFFGGLPQDELGVGAQTVALAMSNSPAGEWSFVMLSSPLLATITLGLSWATLVGEGAIAACHLASAECLHGVRQMLLFWFIALTYLLLPVMGFAFVLTVMGYAQCRPADNEARLRYLALFLIIHLTLVPWKDMIASRV